MRSVWFSVACLSLACGGAATPAPQLASSQVTELLALPPGYEAGEGLEASCTPVSASAGIVEGALGDIDCSFDRLSRVLRARAGERGARFVVDKACRLSSDLAGRLECSATIVKATSDVGLDTPAPPLASRPAPSPAQVLDIDDPRPQDTQQIRVSFRRPAHARQVPWSPRAYDQVAETAQPPVVGGLLGTVSASCEGCSVESLRYALRVTAGRVGAGEISSVACLHEAAIVRCVATAIAPWSS